MANLQDLSQLPAELPHAAALLGGVDQCLALGFGRLGAEQQAALSSLARALGPTPLGPRLTEALAALRRAELRDTHFAAIAAARAAVQGSLYDALQATVAQALGRSPPPPPPGPPAPPPAGAHKSFLESTRHWLMELAIAGFRQLEPEVLLPFQVTLERLQGEPALTRLSALLTGLFTELLAALPVAALPRLPAYRWADLWSRAMVLALRHRPSAAATPVSGELRLLGTDLRHHEHTLSLVAYGLLRQPAPRLLRVHRAVYKVPVLAGREPFRLLGDAALLKALAEPTTLQIKDMPLLPSGDLLWDDARAKAGAGFDLFAEARAFLPGAAAPALPPLPAADRHPVQLAELLCLEGYRVRGGKGDLSLEIGGARLPVATARLSPSAELSLEKIEKSQKALGLLRFDGGQFNFQPLAVHSGKELALGCSAAASVARTPSRDDAVSTLRERASKLLRQKA